MKEGAIFCGQVGENGSIYRRDKQTMKVYVNMRGRESTERLKKRPCENFENPLEKLEKVEVVVPSLDWSAAGL